MSNGLVSANGYSLNVECLCAAGNEIFAGTDNGIFVSSNHGDTWAETNFNPGDGEVNAILVEDSLIFAGSVDDRLPQLTEPGLFLSNDNGQSWARVDSAIRGNSGWYFSVYALTSIGSTIFAGSWGGVYSSKDNYKTTRCDSSEGFAYSFATIESTLFVGFDQAWFVDRSFNMGATWTRCDSGLPDPGGLYTIRGMAATGKNLLAGIVLPYGVYVSTDMGNYWRPINDGLVDTVQGRVDTLLCRSVYSLAVMRDYAFAGAWPGIWRMPISQITAVRREAPAFPNGFELRAKLSKPF